MLMMRAAPLTFVLCVVCALTSSIARAQDSERVALFKTASEDENLADLANALDPVIGSGLGEIANVTIAARAAVDLPSFLFAIDCPGETIDCLKAAATQSEAEGVVAGSLRIDGADIVFTLVRFDPKQTAPVRAERRYTGAGIGERALSDVRDMLTELFQSGVPAAGSETVPAATPVPAAEASSPLTSASPPPRARPLPILPIVIGGIGVALVGTGVVFGVLKNASEDEFADERPNEQPTNALGRASADRATEAFDRAETQAVISNVMFGIGAGALIGAGVLFYWQMREQRSGEARVAVTPALGTRIVGLTMTAAWNGGL